MAVMSALISAAVLLISPVSVASADVAPGTAQVSSASAGHAVQSSAATICYWLPRLPGCPIKKG
jgi:hypothetical protein